MVVIINHSIVWSFELIFVETSLVAWRSILIVTNEFASHGISEWSLLCNSAVRHDFTLSLSLWFYMTLQLIAWYNRKIPPINLLFFVIIIPSRRACPFIWKKKLLIHLYKGCVGPNLVNGGPWWLLDRKRKMSKVTRPRQTADKYWSEKFTYFKPSIQKTRRYVYFIMFVW